MVGTMRVWLLPKKTMGSGFAKLLRELILLWLRAVRNASTEFAEIIALPSAFVKVKNNCNLFES